MPVFRCPSSLPQEIRKVAAFYSQWSHGTLPAPGGVLDQSASFVQAMRLLDVASAEMMDRRNESAKKPQGQSGQDLRAMFGKK